MSKQTDLLKSHDSICTVSHSVYLALIAIPLLISYSTTDPPMSNVFKAYNNRRQ